MKKTVVIRKGLVADIENISRVYAESWRTTYEGFAPDVFLNGINESAAAKIFAESLKPNSYSYFLYVAEVEGKIVGFSDGGKERSHPERGIGELYAVYLLKAYQGQGIGRLLLASGVQSLRQSGMNSMVTWVMENSPYRRFYEKIKGKLGPEKKKLNVGGQDITAVCYAWPDLGALTL